jgi:hypothetical protein
MAAEYGLIGLAITITFALMAITLKMAADVNHLHLHPRISVMGSGLKTTVRLFRLHGKPFPKSPLRFIYAALVVTGISAFYIVRHPAGVQAQN